MFTTRHLVIYMHESDTQKIQRFIRQINARKVTPGKIRDILLHVDRERISRLLGRVRQSHAHHLRRQGSASRGIVRGKSPLLLGEPPSPPGVPEDPSVSESVSVPDKSKVPNPEINTNITAAARRPLSVPQLSPNAGAPVGPQVRQPKSEPEAVSRISGAGSSSQILDPTLSTPELSLSPPKYITRKYQSEAAREWRSIAVYTHKTQNPLAISKVPTIDELWLKHWQRFANTRN